MVRRSRGIVGVLVGVGAAITACASIVGVEDASLDPLLLDGGAVTADTGLSTTSSSTSSSGVLISDAGFDAPDTSDIIPPCAGEGCTCAEAKDCIDPIFAQCHDGKCRACTTTPDSCPQDQYCEASSLSCVPGCKNTAACAGKLCDTTIHRCVDCIVATDCTGGKVCSSGICADTCQASTIGSPCGTAGTTCCAAGTSAACIDTQSDRNNCGGCDKKCTGANQLCCKGKCVDVSTDKANCGACELACSTQHATAPNAVSCAARSCKWTCDPGFNHCVNGNSGCETATNTTTQCGGCAIDCNAQIAHASPKTCATPSYKCTYGTCDPGFVDNNGNKADGCEAIQCGIAGNPCCATGAPCIESTLRCDKTTNTCVACQASGRCDDTNDLCCSSCNPGGNCR